MRRPRHALTEYRLPQPPAPEPQPGSFVCVPVSCLPVISPEQRGVQFWLYQAALEEARSVARPSILERDLLAVWN